MTIEEFIEARLAEDEAAARKAAEFPYDAPSDAPWVSMQLRVQRGAALTSDEHFARHDPARVLRQVAAMQSVVGRRAGEHRNQRGICETCRDYDFRRDYDPVPWPCPTAQAIASIWSDHPDYQQEWQQQ
ncbi:DUF6221 family protein [Nocardia cyriacigeorgica]|uniref:DUF6221 family protein n=1 Tax=Nocardia cyriacigeorgica TaxID=135487 RepID=UPI00245782BE|nr:DUF6221 family protein [Nocardia cyriacigeorgica]